MHRQYAMYKARPALRSRHHPKHLRLVRLGTCLCSRGVLFSCSRPRPRAPQRVHRAGGAADPLQPGGRPTTGGHPGARRGLRRRVGRPHRGCRCRGRGLRARPRRQVATRREPEPRARAKFASWGEVGLGVLRRSSIKRGRARPTIYVRSRGPSEFWPGIASQKRVVARKPDVGAHSRPARDPLNDLPLAIPSRIHHAPSNFEPCAPSFGQCSERPPLRT